MWSQKTDLIPGSALLFGYEYYEYWQFHLAQPNKAVYPQVKQLLFIGLHFLGSKVALTLPLPTKGFV